MSTRTSAARYARALFDVAQRESDLTKVYHDLGTIVSVMTESQDLARVLANRAVPEAARRDILAAVSAKLGVEAPVARLLAMLAERGRLELLPDIASVFHDRLLAHRNMVQAEVRTAAPLSAEAEASLLASLASATGKQITMRVSVDPSLLGGVVARVGSTVYDGSVRTQLKKMREQLVAQA